MRSSSARTASPPAITRASRNTMAVVFCSRHMTPRRTRPTFFTRSDRRSWRERDFKSFLARYLPAQPGERRTLAGERLGRHDGLMYYTLGQRHGLGIGGAGEAWYVARQDLASNTLYVVQGENHPALFSHGLEADDLHWIAGASPALPLSCTPQTPYPHPDQPCVLTRSPEALDVRFELLQRAVTSGQSV